jgi:hypothetical protein
MMCALLRYVAMLCVVSCVAATSPDAENLALLEAVRVAKRAALDRHIDMTNYHLSGRSWLSAERQWTISFAGWGSESGRFIRVLIDDKTKKATVVRDR